MAIARPWDHGRSVMAYTGIGPAARWMARAAEPLLQDDTLIVSVPLHRVRLIQRRYNQSAVLAGVLAKAINRDLCVDSLIRTRNTAPLKVHSRGAHFAELSEAIKPNPSQRFKFRIV